jgi:hypothetical protein
VKVADLTARHRKEQAGTWLSRKHRLPLLDKNIYRFSNAFLSRSYKTCKGRLFIHALCRGACTKPEATQTCNKGIAFKKMAHRLYSEKLKWQQRKSLGYIKQSEAQCKNLTYTVRTIL